jgi:hypothetical protein
MADFGVTAEGFVIKPFDVILDESRQRAQQMFGANVDLSPTSPLLKILQLVAAEDAALWQHLEDLYYSGFASTAVGDELDLLGENVGLARRFLFAVGEVTITVNNPQPNRVYVLPEGTRLVTATPPALAFGTTDEILLDATTPQRRVGVQAFARGKASDLPAATALQVDTVYARLHLGLHPSTTLAVARVGDFAGGAVPEGDNDYRERLLGLPRNLWTLGSVRATILEVDGVNDVRLSDPLGGVDVSQTYFNLFDFGKRLFGSERRLGEPYFFDVVVAHDFAWPWRTEAIPPLVAPVEGVFERVTKAVDRVRPIGIHPRVVEADHIEVGVRARVLIASGYDREALRTALKDRLARDVGALKLGGDVLFSQVMGAFVELSGVVDVQDMHLRRCPPAFGRITFGPVRFQSVVIEEPGGENLSMAPTEIAVFRLDSDLIDIEVTER